MTKKWRNGMNLIIKYTLIYVWIVVIVSWGNYRIEQNFSESIYPLILGLFVILYLMEKYNQEKRKTITIKDKHTYE